MYDMRSHACFSYLSPKYTLQNQASKSDCKIPALLHLMAYFLCPPVVETDPLCVTARSSDLLCFYWLGWGHSGTGRHASLELAQLILRACLGLHDLEESGQQAARQTQVSCRSLIQCGAGSEHLRMRLLHSASSHTDKRLKLSFGLILLGWCSDVILILACTQTLIIALHFKRQSKAIREDSPPKEEADE